MTHKERKEILKQHMGKRVFSYHTGYNEIINTKSIEEIKEDTLNILANRKQAYIYTGGWDTPKLWDITKG